jgi:hypothetical protein
VLTADGWNVINLKELRRKQSRPISRHYPVGTDENHNILE